MRGRDIQETLLPPRTPGLEISTGEAHSQSQCHLFRLPAELRLRIYEFVIGSGQVHIDRRSCTEFETPLSKRSIKQCTGGYLVSYSKLTYSTCNSPASFQARYALSQLPSNIPETHYNSRGQVSNLSSPELAGAILPEWAMEHEACYSAPEKDMAYQAYASVVCDANTDRCRHQDPKYRMYETCETCAILREDAEKTYGPPTASQGLQKFHADTALQHSGLLLSCRKVYDEARMLPFKLYSFDAEATCLRPMMESWLEPWQKNAIERLHVSCGELMFFRQAMDIVGGFQELKMLEMDIRRNDQLDEELGSLKSIGEKIESVEVVVGCDRDRKIGREVRRARAEQLEELIRGSKALA